MLTATTLACVAAIGAGAPVASAGVVPLQSCESSSGTIRFQPGLLATSHAQTAKLAATIAGCSHLGGSPQPDSGSFVAKLSGPASSSNIMLSGPFTINWPASSEATPSKGTLEVFGPKNGVYTVSGEVNTGAFATGVIRTTYRVTTTTPRSRSTLQSLVNASPLQVLFNLG
jgi:hypothetical protein